MRTWRLIWLLAAMASWAAAPAAAWAGTTKVFPLTARQELPARLEGAPEALTRAIAKLAGGSISDHSISGVALGAGCTLDDSTCLDRIARLHRADEIVFGTIRAGEDRRVLVKLTRHIAGTERRERTYVLTGKTQAALARQLARAAREMFDLGPPDEEEDDDDDDDAPSAEAEAPRKAPRRPKAPEEAEGPEAEGAARGGEGGGGGDPDGAPAAVRRGRVTRGTYFLLCGGVATLATGAGFAVAAHALGDDLANARRNTPDDTARIAAIERARGRRATTAAVLLAAGGLATAGAVVRAVIQRRPIDPAVPDRAVSVVPHGGGAMIVLSGRLP